MLRSRPVRASRATLVVARLAAVLSIAYLAAGIAAHLATAPADRADLLATPEPVIGPAMALVGAVLLGRVPRGAAGHRVLLLTAVIGCSACVYAGSIGIAVHGAAGPAPVDDVAAWLAQWTWIPAFVPFATLLPLVFPDGRLPSPRWRPVAAAAVGLVVVMVPFAAFTDVGSTAGRPANPLAADALEPAVDVLGGVLFAALPVLALAAIAGLVVRFRRADAQERRQIAWVGYALAWVVGAAWISPPLFAVTTLAVPLAIGVAVVRYRLFGIDVVLNRTLVGAALLASSALVYVAVVGWFGGLAGRRDSLVGFAGAVAVAAVFHPLYVRIQRGVDRLLHGHRGDPYQVLGRVTEVLRVAGSPRQALGRAVAVLAAELKLPAVSVTVERPGAAPVVESVGDEVLAVHAFPLEWHDDVVGTLRVGHRAGSGDLDALDEALVADVAAQLAAVGFALRLATDLERSRDRLVTAREEERRRIRRDLHDGLGPQLASAVMALDVADRALGREPARAVPLVATARDQLQDAVADVRRIVHGLRPPALDDLGLLGALQAGGPGLLAGTDGAPDIRIEGRGELGGLPAAVEVAAFRITQEALTNAVRHADAAHIAVHLSRGPDAVRIDVVDDGTGCPDDAPAGIGLDSMRDRAAELGGSCRIAPEPGGGTRVSAVLPLGGTP
ncbi:sensor histidine kinase [Blastococcus sp. SYSU D01042]